MKAVFLDSSAVLAVILHESKRDAALAKINAADHLVASRLLKVECERALIRYALDRPDLGARLSDLRRELVLLLPKISFIDMSAAICDAAGRISPSSRLRTLDAIHLATYFRLREASPDIEMLTYDERLRGELADV